MVNNVILLWRNTEPANTFLVQGDQYKTSNLQNYKVKTVLFKPLNLLKLLAAIENKRHIWSRSGPNMQFGDTPV